MLVGAALGVCLVALGFLLTAVCRTVMQLNALSNIGALVFAGIGGALTPLSTLPGWARGGGAGHPQLLGHAGFRSVILDGASVGAVLLPCAMLLLFGVGFGLVAARRFRYAETKTSWA